MSLATFEMSMEDVRQAEPSSHAGPSTPPPASIPSPGASRPPLRILIVEDDQQLRTLLGNYLSRFNGVIVTPASDLASALHLSANVSFDAAILDVNLPDGMTISKHVSLKAQLGDIPLIYITGYRDGALAALPDGVLPPPIISKPFRPNELKQALSDVLEP